MKRLALCLVLAACGKAKTVPAGLTHFEGLAHNHVASCTVSAECGNGSDPPAGGPHCPSWLPCHIYATPQNRCEYLHNLEHGHMILLYNCPAGCDDIVSQLSSYWDTLPAPRRALVAPDRTIGSRVAAMVWGYTWSGDKVDQKMLDALFMLQDTEAPEAGLSCSQ